MGKKAFKEVQLSLFDPPTPEAFASSETRQKPPTVLEFIRARFEHGPEMTEEEYRRWIKILVNHSLKRME